MAEATLDVKGPLRRSIGSAGESRSIFQVPNEGSFAPPPEAIEAKMLPCRSHTDSCSGVLFRSAWLSFGIHRPMRPLCLEKGTEFQGALLWGCLNARKHKFVGAFCCQTHPNKEPLGQVSGARSSRGEVAPGLLVANDDNWSRCASALRRTHLGSFVVVGKQVTFCVSWFSG